jgi:hypothetical protein
MDDCTPSAPKCHCAIESQFTTKALDRDEDIT